MSKQKSFISLSAKIRTRLAISIFRSDNCYFILSMKKNEITSSEKSLRVVLLLSLDTQQYSMEENENEKQKLKLYLIFTAFVVSWLIHRLEKMNSPDL